MKGKYKFLLLALLIAFASCSFTSKKFEDPDKDKLLMQLITYLLDQGHFEPKDINDDFSFEVFEDYLNNVDQFKRFFYASDIKEFKAYQDKIDDQIKAYDVSFFNLTHQRLLQRIAEAKEIYKNSTKNYQSHSTEVLQERLFLLKQNLEWQIDYKIRDLSEESLKTGTEVSILFKQLL